MRRDDPAGSDIVAASGAAGRGLHREGSRAARDAPGDDAVTRQSAEVQPSGTGGKVGERRSPRPPGLEQPLEGIEVSAALKLGVEREHLVLPAGPIGEGEQMV